MFVKAKNAACGALLVVLSLILALSICGVAWASSANSGKASGSDSSTTLVASQSATVDNAGNVFGTSNASEAFVEPAKRIERDFYWASNNVDVDMVEAGADILVAGLDVGIYNSTAGGSVRAGGTDVSLKNVKVSNNVTLAGENVDVAGCDAQGGIYVVGRNVNIAGTYNGGMILSDKVVFNGTVNGNLEIHSDAVEIGPNAVITGQLKVYSPGNPKISESAQVNAYEYSYANFQSAVSHTFSGYIATITLVSKGVAFVSTILFAIALAWLVRRPVENAASMTRKHAGRIFATGAIALLVIPPVLFLLFCFLIAAPIAVALLLMILVIIMISVPFAAASLSRLVFPKLNHIGSAAIGGVALGAVLVIPYIGILLMLACYLYTLGFIIQTIWQNRKYEPEPEGKLDDGKTEQPAPPTQQIPLATEPAPTQQIPLEQPEAPTQQI